MNTHRDVVLEISDLRVIFHTYAGDVRALDGVNLQLFRGEVLGLVGESGCGKSVTALSITRLLPENAEIVSGDVILNGEGLLKKTKEEMREVRMKSIAMVFQDPMTYLNPVLTIGEQLLEVYLLDPLGLSKRFLRQRIADLGKMKEPDGQHRELLEQRTSKMERKLSAGSALGRRELRAVAKEMCVRVLQTVKLPDPGRILKEYPHELSGGMRQRAMIAMALARRPALFIADEITTALDVTTQAQILSLLKELKSQIGASILIITHDLGIVAEMCDRVAVMYGGNVVEVAEVHELFRNPLHPYTKGLLGAIPRIAGESERLSSITGSVPDLIYPPPGCRFHPRCPHAFDRCSKVKPLLTEIGNDHHVACFLYHG